MYSSASQSSFCLFCFSMTRCICDRLPRSGRAGSRPDRKQQTAGSHGKHSPLWRSSYRSTGKCISTRNVNRAPHQEWTYHLPIKLLCCCIQVHTAWVGACLQVPCVIWSNQIPPHVSGLPPCPAIETAARVAAASLTEILSQALLDR